MGSLCSSCSKGTAGEEVNVITPSAEVRRRLQQEAAEKRLQQNEYRGIKDPERVRRQQQLAEEKEKRQEEALKMGAGNAHLKWQAD